MPNHLEDITFEMSSLEIVSNFITLLDDEQKYQEAAKLLDDFDFKFLLPQAKFHDKSDWVRRFPKFHKDPPIFENLMPGENDKQVVRKGEKKIALFTIHLIETYELNDQGKIVKISAAMA
jgi:hypothetical protein